MNDHSPQVLRKGKLLSKFTFSFIALIILCCAISAHSFFDPQQSVSRETHLRTNDLAQYAGTSFDGTVRLMQVREAPHVAPHMKFSNHARNLRIFVAHGKNDTPLLYVEQAKPHRYFALKFSTPLNPLARSLARTDYLSFTWKTASSVEFYEAESDGSFTRYLLELHGLALVHTPNVPEPTPLSRSHDEVVL